MKKCPSGQYYCFTDKKCKKIPMGYHVGGRGMLEKDTDTESETKKNGNGNGNGNGGNGGGMGEELVYEGGNLRQWFKGSKSKDGKGGWVNVVTGGTCASDEPGEGTPKCVSSAKRASMTKAERLSAQRRKKKADPGQQQKTGASKPTYVSTDPKKKMKKEEKDHEVSMAHSQLNKSEKNIKKLKKGLGKKEKNLPAWMQAKITDTEHNMDAAASYVGEAKDKPGKGSGKKDACYHKVKARYDVWPSAYASGALVKCRKKGAKNWGNSTKKEDFMALPEFSEMQIRAMRNQGIEVEVVGEDCWDGYEKKGMKTMFGKRYPNCVKKKKKTKKEEFIPEEEKTELQKKASRGDKSAMSKLKQLRAAGKIGKEYGFEPGAKNESVTLEKANGKEFAEVIDLITNADLGTTMSEAVQMRSEMGNMYIVTFTWRAQMKLLKIFFPEVRKPSKMEVEMAINKIYPGARVRSFYVIDNPKNDEMYLNVGPVDKYAEFDEETEIEEGAAWTKKSGKNPSGGLNEKGRKSYERENPGSDLKAPSKKVGNKRRASFCARMKGMKKKLTSSKTANDPDSRINKSLRAWNC